MAPDDRSLQQPEAAADRRRPYREPELVEYGTVAKLTESGGNSAPESGVPDMMMACL